MYNFFGGYFITLESLRQQKKAHPLSAIKLKSTDINFLHAPRFDFISSKSIGFIKEWPVKKRA